MTAPDPADTVTKTAAKVSSSLEESLPDAVINRVRPDDIASIANATITALAMHKMLADPADRDELEAWRSGRRRKAWPTIESVPDGLHYAAELARAQGTEGGEAHDELLRQAATRLKNLNDHARMLLAEKERAEAEVAELEHRLACLLDELTGGRMSGTGYDVPTMVQEVEAYFERTVDDEVAELRAIRDRVRALADRWERWGHDGVPIRPSTAAGYLRAALDGAGEQ